MRFSLILSSLLLLFDFTRSLPLPRKNSSSKDIEHGMFSDAQRQALIYRLDHSEGAAHQLSLFKMLLLSQKSVDSCKEQGNCIEQIVDKIEQIVLLLYYTGKLEEGNLSGILRQAKYYTNQLSDVKKDYDTKMNLLPEPFKYCLAHSMNESISSFLSHELRKLQRLQLELLATGESHSVWIKIGEVAAHCFAAMSSGIKTFQIMGLNFDVNQKVTDKLASWFHFQYNSKVDKSLFHRDENPSRDITDDMNYLREGLSITIKAGMFLLLCMQYQVYLCAAAFGFMISVSCFIWMSVYLEMVSTTV